MGNGTYRRQVLGLVAATESLVILVRRFVCRGCRVSIAVLPDALLAGRWYAGTAIFLALVLSLVRGHSAGEVRGRLAQPGESAGWKTLDRWQRQLLAPLWRWMGAQIGFGGQKPAEGRAERADRLRRLLGLRGAHGRSPDDALQRAACALSAGSVHSRAQSWLIGRDH